MATKVEDLECDACRYVTAYFDETGYGIDKAQEMAAKFVGFFVAAIREETTEQIKQTIREQGEFLPGSKDNGNDKYYCPYEDSYCIEASLVAPKEKEVKTDDGGRGWTREELEAVLRYDLHEIIGR